MRGAPPTAAPERDRMVGMLSLLHPAPLPVTPVLLVGIVECAFSALLLLRWKRRGRT